MKLRINQSSSSKTYINKKKQVWIAMLSIFVVLSFSLVGCKKTGAKIVLTTDFNEDEIFRIEDNICTKPEIMVYLVNIENNYDEIFSEEIWNVPYGEGTVESQYKESVLARIAQIKAMNLFAASKGIELDDVEARKVSAAAKEYMNSLSAAEVEYLGVTEELITKMYGEYALANKLYGEITDSVNPEISDDEARSIAVKSILIKTYKLDERGQKIPYSEGEKETARKKAEALLTRINEGEDFDVIASDNNEDEKLLYTFGRGVMPEEIEKTAYNMSEGEISGIVESEFGYHILKCVSNFDMEQTDLNKITIVETRKEEAFTEEYDGFISSLTSNLNKDLWDEITYVKVDGINTVSFFSVYDKYFSE